jgi:predicted RNA binding protein YcfA (HicA-like mRNA interferase family)
MTPPRTYAATVAYLRALGATHVRTRSTHEQWRLPNGHRICLPVAHGEAGRKAWDGFRILRRWSELQAALQRAPTDTGWGRYRPR